MRYRMLHVRMTKGDTESVLWCEGDVGVMWGWHGEGDVLLGWCEGSPCGQARYDRQPLWEDHHHLVVRHDQEGVLITNVQSICKKYTCYTNVPTYPYTINCIYWILTKGAEAERKRKGGESRVTWQRYSPRNLVWDVFFFNFLIS